MSKRVTKFLLLFLFSVTCLGVGCRSEGGTAGDSNDPALTGEDEEMDSEETDEMPAD